MKDKFCKECTHSGNEKPRPKCGASRFSDLVDGGGKRPCLIERLDGIGRCGALGNHFAQKTKPAIKAKAS